jgi:hypothetical protein
VLLVFARYGVVGCIERVVGCRLLKAVGSRVKSQLLENHVGERKMLHVDPGWSGGSNAMFVASRCTHDVGVLCYVTSTIA